MSVSPDRPAPAPPPGGPDPVTPEAGPHPSTGPGTGPGTLRAPAHQVSPRAPALWAAVAAVEAVTVLAVLVVVRVLDWWRVPWWAWVVWALAAVALVVVVPPLRYRMQRWETTETAVYTQTGLLSRELRIAPMSRVQTVDFEQGPVERLLGLASVTVTTASAAGPLHINAVDKRVADHLVEDLTRRAEAEADDAT